ncbi:MAG: cytochrome c3 family protein [Anaerolineales bacterium]|nr:cytochrome c3 family protein [Anaerolineales bacterium]
MRCAFNMIWGGPLRFIAWTFGLLLFLAAILWWTGTARAVALQPSRPLDNAECLGCHAQPNMILRVGINNILITVDPQKFQDSIHGQNGLLCADCHPDISAYPHPDSYSQTNRREFQFALYETTQKACANCHAGQVSDAASGVHQQTLHAGNHNAAFCADCHYPHYVDPEIDLQRAQIPDVCARCHSEIAALYKKSVHGAALTGEGNPDAPTCVSCHGNHKIVDPRTVEFRNAIPPCARSCHTSKEIMEKYGLSTNVMQTYVADYHGTTVTLFEQTSPNLPTNKPVCTDCHGVHNISSTKDPVSGIGLKQNLLPKCQRCHPDANENFPDAWMSHYNASPAKYPLVFFVNLFYWIMIPGVIGGMLFFVATDIIRRAIDHWKGAWR